MSDPRSSALFAAKIAEQAERYNDMVDEMKRIGRMAGEQELSVEERNLLSVGYKNLVGARRASWRILQSVEQSEVAKGNEKRVKLIQKYRAVVEKELDTICGEILELLDEHLIPSASACEASVFYLKMKADYHRYLSEFKTEDERKDAAEKTLLAYTAAQEKALAELPSTNPIRLGLALNFSVFYYEVMNQPEKACSLAKQVRRRFGCVCAVLRGDRAARRRRCITLLMRARARARLAASPAHARMHALVRETQEMRLPPASAIQKTHTHPAPKPPNTTTKQKKQYKKKAFDEAISDLDTLGEDSYKDSALIMQLLRDNLTLWTSEMQDGDNKAGGDAAA